MVKATKAKKRTPIYRPKQQSAGAVTAINTAPVSIGNSVRGSEPRITHAKDGARVVGRDFAFSLGSTAASVVGWELIGGMPISPCVLVSSGLRSYSQLCQFFKVNRFVIHYITSSTTAQAGDVVFYYNRDPSNPFLDYTNSAFLPTVLSDSHTVLGPQWTNHSAMLNCDGKWRSTAFGMNADLSEDRAGEIFLLSKTSSANSPGVILIDYDITFKNMVQNPRAGLLPVARALTTYGCLTSPATAPAAGNAWSFTINTGKCVDATTAVVPTGFINGDVYKCILQVTSSTLSGLNAAWNGSVVPTTANIMRWGDSNTDFTIDDGNTFYAKWSSSSTVKLFPTMEEAVTETGAIEITNTLAGATSVNLNICCVLMLVRNVNDYTQNKY